MDSHTPKRLSKIIECLTIAFIVSFAMHGLEARGDDPGKDVSRSTANVAMLEDAELASVFFLDPMRGWAVGDRGVIWQTLDGGRHWRLQHVEAECRLESIHFGDERHGWIAGGWTEPFTGVSRGVLLRTSDGGKHWHPERTDALPRLHRVKFFDATRGAAIGDPSPMYPSGVFITDDGGRSWTPLPAEKPRRWVCGDFLDPTLGALAGENATLATVRHRSIVGSTSPNAGLRGLAALSLNADGRGWLVGEGGLVFRTTNLGQYWQLPTAELPDEVRRGFDWSALAQHGSHVWIVGSPGSRVLHSADGGQSWTAQDTGQSLPLRDVTFVDDQHGSAVGALGTILTTSDGGLSWQRSRNGGTRAAFLCLYGKADQIPWELLAQLSAEDGYLGSVELLNRREANIETDRVSRTRQLHEAVVAVGASAGRSSWQFPIAQRGIGLNADRLIRIWNDANDGDGLGELEEHIVRQIRVWRPDIILTHAPSTEDDDAVDHLLNQMVLRAVEAAADPTRFSDQLIQAGLGPWRVKKVVAPVVPGQQGTLQVTKSAFAPRLGRTLAAQTLTSRGILALPEDNTPEMLGFWLLLDHIPQQRGRHDFFSGIVLHPGGEARRMLGPVDEPSDATRRAANRHRNLQAILKRLDQDPETKDRYLASLGPLLDDLESGSAVDVLNRLAQEYHHTGRWSLAAESYTLLAAQSPEHPLAGEALVWLLHYWSSGEAALRMHRDTPQAARSDSAFAATTLRQVLPETEPAGSPAVRPVARIEPPNAADVARVLPGERATQASEIGKRIMARDPALFEQPRVRFPLAVAHRKQGYPRQAERFYLATRRGRPHDSWWACAEGEHWLQEPQTMPPKPIWDCVVAAGKPRLDGNLDDPLWQQAKAVTLSSPLGDDASWPAVARMAYDQEYLYLAVSCREVPDYPYSDEHSPRSRDPDLSKQDRIELYLDIDRDWATAYRLVIDHRGWVAEDCWGDKTWNPTWYVAAHHGEGNWHVEVAIPWTQLTAEPPRHRDVWAVGVQRVVPGVGFQSWSKPAAPEAVMQGMGYLIFQ